MTVALSIRGLVAGYDRVPVVRDLDLRVDRGEVVALLGPNGAGKTTTLAAAAGLIRPMAGAVEVNGAVVGGLPAHRVARRGLMLVPEDRALFAQLTVRENLRLVRSWKASSTDEVLDLLPALGPLLDRRAGLLSGGEQQMLSLARGLIGRPSVLLVDELSLGLAPVIVEALLPVLSRVAAETGCGVLLVEQHVELALQAASRGYVLRRGRCVLEGPSDRLAADRSVLAASYLGDSNTLITRS